MSNRVNQVFDKVYVLSLKSDEDRRSKMKRRLIALDIDFEFYDAIDGNSICFDREWIIYNSRPLSTEQERKKNRKLITSRGAWGCLRSYISLLRNTLSQGYQKVLIFEDDIFLSKKFNQDFSKLIESTDEDWKLLFLGASHGHWTNEKFYNRFYYPTPEWTYGAFAVGYDRSVIPSIIDEALHMLSPYDKQPLTSVMLQYPNKCFVSYPNIVIADVRDSNIREKRDFERHAEKMKWKLSMFDIL